MKDFVVIIPARYASSRFPGKPLALIQGKPMVLWVYELALQSGASDVCIATDDERIAQTGREAGARVIMTSPDLASGTDRVCAAACKMGLSDDRIVVNVQGDEPMLPSSVIDSVVRALFQHADADMATLSVPIIDSDELASINTVKLVADKNGRALYFSRSPIPFFNPDKKREATEMIWRRHLGIYAYSVGFLKKYVRWDKNAYEQVESLEQLRALFNGAYITVGEGKDAHPPGIDTPEDLKSLENSLKKI